MNFSINHQYWGKIEKIANTTEKFELDGGVGDVELNGGAGDFECYGDYLDLNEF
jgi:hypothetical protein